MAEDKVWDAIEQQMKTDITYIALSAVFICVISTVVFYILVRLYKVIRRYFDARDTIRSRMHQSMVGPKRRPLLLSTLDDDVYPPMDDDTGGDADAKIADTMKKTFAEYSQYNQSLAKHYENNRKQAAPDLLDKSSLVKDNDDW